jgi:hypothetical protein
MTAYSDAVKKLSDVDKNQHAVAKPPQKYTIQPWKQTVKGDSDAQVISIHGIYVFVRYTGYTDNHISDQFVTNWYDSIDFFKLLCNHFKISFLQVHRDCADYLVMLNLPPHYLPFINQFKNKTAQEISTLLRNDVKFQNDAIDRAAEEIDLLLIDIEDLQNDEANMNDCDNIFVPLHKPTCLTFAGPPATGKTHLAESIAKHLGVLGTPGYVTEIGSSLSSEYDVSKLNGPAPGLVGAESNTLYRRLQAACDMAIAEPDCIVVVFIDEIHLAHTEVQNLLREFLYSGKFTSMPAGANILFPRPILVILAANWGVDAIIKYCDDKRQLSLPLTAATMYVKVLEDMKENFGLEGATRSRYEPIIPFVPFTKAEVNSLLDTLMNSIVSSSKHRHLQITYDAAIIDYFVQFYQQSEGIRRQISDLKFMMRRVLRKIRTLEETYTIYTYSTHKLSQVGSSVQIQRNDSIDSVTIRLPGVNFII